MAKRNSSRTDGFSMVLYTLALLLVVSACSRSERDTADAPQDPGEEKQALAPPLQTVGDDPLPEDLQGLNPVWYGDFDEMVTRRFIRVLVSFSRTNYFLDGAEQKGITYEALKLFEEEINEQLETGHLKVHVVFIPVPRDRLIPGLVEGRGDIAAANLTITPERTELVDFSAPFAADVSEIVVSGPQSPVVETLEDLSGKEIVVRASSSYYESLMRLNEIFERQGMAPVGVTPADEHLEDEDLLDMVQAGLLPMVVVDDHKARFWKQIFDDLTLHPDIAVATGGQIAWAFRKESPGIRRVINDFVEKHKEGTLMGNILIKRYLRSTKWVERSLSGERIEKLQGMVDLFKKYGEIYGFDWLMLAALGYQESQLDQSTRSAAGAVGVMQVLPSTAADRNVGIPDIDILENNIHAGTKYLRFVRDRYFSDEEVKGFDPTLFSFASYNAGPARVAGLRRQAAQMGLDPNTWFGHVEVVAAREIGRETVQYVSNIFKYYIAYQRIADELEKKRRLQS